MWLFSSGLCPNIFQPTVFKVSCWEPTFSFLHCWFIPILFPINFHGKLSFFKIPAILQHSLQETLLAVEAPRRRLRFFACWEWPSLFHTVTSPYANCNSERRSPLIHSLSDASFRGIRLASCRVASSAPRGLNCKMKRDRVTGSVGLFGQHGLKMFCLTKWMPGAILGIWPVLFDRQARMENCKRLGESRQGKEDSSQHTTWTVFLEEGGGGVTRMT